ncbi:hypothetical protein D3C77_564450 [compost metagenome]
MEATSIYRHSPQIPWATRKIYSSFERGFGAAKKQDLTCWHTLRSFQREAAIQDHTPELPAQALDLFSPNVGNAHVAWHEYQRRPLTVEPIESDFNRQTTIAPHKLHFWSDTSSSVQRCSGHTSLLTNQLRLGPKQASSTELLS